MFTNFVTELTFFILVFTRVKGLDQDDKPIFEYVPVISTNIVMMVPTVLLRAPYGSKTMYETKVSPAVRGKFATTIQRDMEAKTSCQSFKLRGSSISRTHASCRHILVSNDHFF